MILHDLQAAERAHTERAHTKGVGTLTCRNGKRRSAGELEPLDTFVRQINHELATVEMVVRTARDELTGETFYGLVGTSKNATMATATTFKRAELEMFEVVLQFMIDGNGWLDQQQFFQQRQQVKISERESHALLIELKNEGWLQLITREVDGKVVEGYTLGSRGFVEFHDYLLCEELVSTCELCKTILFYGESCGNEKCEAVAHVACLATSMRNAQAFGCPACHTPWPRLVTTSPLPSRGAE